MVESTYTDFIDSIKTSEFGGFNGIEYSDGGFEPYISFQALLKWVGEYPNLFSAEFPIIKVDYESDKPLFMYSTSVSCDLSKCYIRNGYLKTTLGTFDPSIAPSFKNINTFTDGNYSVLNSTLKEEAGVIEDISMYPQIGNINFIYLSVSYLSELILKQSDNSDNKVTVGTFLQKVCDGVNKALGSINDLQVITDVDGIVETLTIVDYQQKRIKGLPDIRKEEKRTITTIQAQGLGSMLTSIQAQSTITPELASTISIGAQAQSQPVGEEATSFSRLSRGFIDRVYPAKVQGDSGAALKREEDRKKAVESKFKQAISSYSKFIKNQIPQPGDFYSPVLLKSTDTTNISNIAAELYKSCLAMFTDTKQTSTAFIPIKLDISLYGIAGTKIYQKFKLSNDVLPLSYQGDYEFIILGVSHTVDATKWETSISSLISLKDEKIKESGPDKPFSVKLSELEPSSTFFSLARVEGETFGTPYQPPTANLFYTTGIENQTRNQSIQDKLFNIINQAAKDNSLIVEIFSAGQDVAGTQRTGSNRHNNGYAADIWMYDANGYNVLTTPPKLLTNNGSKDQGKIEKFSESLLKHGIHSIGAGNGYMNNVGLHVDISIGQPGVPNARYFGKDKTSGETKTVGAAKWLSNLMVNANTKYPVQV